MVLRMAVIGVAIVRYKNKTRKEQSLGFWVKGLNYD
jgi:hypothetical protein